MIIPDSKKMLLQILFKITDLNHEIKFTGLSPLFSTFLR